MISTVTYSYIIFLHILFSGCGGEDFYIYRDNINTSAPIDDHHSYNNNNKLHEVVECKNAECQIATQISALKIKIS